MVAHPEVLVQPRKKLVADGDSVNVLEANTEESLDSDYGRDIVALPGNQAANREHKHRLTVRTR